MRSAARWSSLRPGNADHPAVANQRGVEAPPRHRLPARTACRDGPPERRMRRSDSAHIRPASQPRARAPDCADVGGELGDERAVDKKPAGGLRHRRAPRRPVFAPRRLRCRIGRRGQRLGVAHSSARRSVYFHSSTRRRTVRQARLERTRRTPRRAAPPIASDVAGQPARASRYRPAPAIFGLGRGLDDGDFRVHASTLFLILGIAARFKLERQVLAAGLDDAALRQHVHDIGYDIGEKALVVCDHDGGALEGERQPV